MFTRLKKPGQNLLEYVLIYIALLLSKIDFPIWPGELFLYIIVTFWTVSFETVAVKEIVIHKIRTVIGSCMCVCLFIYLFIGIPFLLKGRGGS